ncbi:MAG: hypothetical protein AB2705_18850 [Candidatus Thiodiazotropha sp.]
MSCEIKKIQKYLEKVNLTFAPSSTIIVCSDSKGRYIRPHIPPQYRQIVQWHVKSGRTTEEGIRYLEREIPNFSRHHGQIVILFWHGTCDVTKKIGPHIYLKHKKEADATDYWHPKYSRLVEILSSYPTIKLAILEIPPISTKIWNKMHGHDSWEIIDDEEVNKQVHLHNEIVQEVNASLNFNFISPKVQNGLLKSNKRKSYSKEKKKALY